MFTFVYQALSLKTFFPIICIPLMRFILSVLIVFSGCLCCPTFAQSDSSSIGSTPFYTEIVGLVSTNDRTPFWLQSNQFGTVPRKAPALSVRGGLQKIWQLTNNNSSARQWQFSLGAEAVANVGITTRILIPQVFGSIQWGNWEFFAGRRKQWVGLADSTLGTGSYVWSGNALPIPKVQIGLTRFTPVPFTKGWLYVLGFYSDGWFDGNRPITSHLKLHQKQLYFQLSKPGSRLALYGGFNHQVQWGGRSPYETVDGQMPNSFQDYTKVIFGRASRGTLDSSATYFDNANRVGNHLGSFDLGIEWKRERTHWLIYRQNIYEDGSLFRLTNIKDGLNGIKVKFGNSEDLNFRISEILFEVLYTKNQGGAIFIFNQRIFGKDNYFNHTQVRDGWSYYDRTIGTPFITPTSDTEWRYPNYGDAFTSNNRVWVLHSGLRGVLNRWEWSAKLSYSSNAGVYDLPFPKTVYQFSSLFTCQTKVNWFGGTIFKGDLAMDLGALYPNTMGLMFSIRKEGLIKPRRQNN